jgi:hypothetical protein
VAGVRPNIGGADPWLSHAAPMSSTAPSGPDSVGVVQVVGDRGDDAQDATGEVALKRSE